MENATLRDAPAMILGGLGLASGVASGLMGADWSLDALQPIADLFFLHASLLPIGVYYATAMGLGLWLLTRRPAPSAVAFLVTLYAWSGAIHVAIRLQRNVGDEWHLIAASLAAGAVGAGLTHLGVSIAMPQTRRWLAFAITIATGAIFGLLFYCGERELIDKRALFIVWQPAVAFVIGLAAGRPISDRQ